MRSDWKETTLGDFAPFNYGKGLPKRKRNSKGVVPVYGSNGITGYHDESLVKKGIVIGRKGSIGEVEFSEKPFWPIDTTFYVKETPERDIRFTYYLLKSLPLEEMNSDSAVPGLNRDAAHHLKIKVPKLEEQQRIADILGTLDDKIELNRQMNHTLEAMARAIFKSWFVDFDPVYAKMEGRDTPLPSEVVDLFPDELVESELGLIPKGWKVGKLKEIIKFNPRYKLSKGTIATYLEMKNLPERGFFPTSWRKREYKSGTKFTNGDTLLARITPCLENGKTAHVNFLKEDEVAWGSTEYIIMRSKKDIPKLYSYLLARDGFFRKGAIKSMTGSSGRQRVQRDTLEELLTVISPINVYSLFEELIIPFFEKMTTNHLENLTLVEIRDTLLPKLINEEIEI